MFVVKPLGTFSTFSHHEIFGVVSSGMFYLSVLLSLVAVTALCQGLEHLPCSAAGTSSLNCPKGSGPSSPGFFQLEGSGNSSDGPLLMGGGELPTSGI